MCEIQAGSLTGRGLPNGKIDAIIDEILIVDLLLSLVPLRRDGWRDGTRQYLKAPGRDRDGCQIDVFEDQGVIVRELG